MSQFKFAYKRVPLGIIEIMEIGVNMELNCAITKRVVERLQAHNIDCYIVGGYVRDHILGIESKDIDIELHNTTIDEAYAIVQTVAEANVFGKFGVISLVAYNTEFAIARTEQKTGLAHTDFSVKFIDNGDLKLAASRRDFTINSMMYDLQNNQLVDNYNGRFDLEHKILRHVSPAFSEDPLRILRGLKFIARYNLQIADQTDQLCRSIIEQLKHLPQIRIQNEIEAIFNADYFERARPLLTDYLGLLFDCQLKPYIELGSGVSAKRIAFFNQFAQYSQVVDFCYEQKNIKRDLKTILDNYQQYQNYSQLTGVEKYDLLTSSKYVIADVEVINPVVCSHYLQFEQLTKQYNGLYFIEQGISGKQIKAATRELIGGKLDEL